MPLGRGDYELEATSGMKSFLKETYITRKLLETIVVKTRFLFHTTTTAAAAVVVLP